MPEHVKQGLSEFAEIAKWVKELEPPADGVAGGFGGSSTAESGQLFLFSVATPLSAEEVLDHYTSLLEARGWQASERLLEETVGIQTFRFSDENSNRWHGLLHTTAGDSEEGRVAVTLRLTRFAEAVRQ